VARAILRLDGKYRASAREARRRGEQFEREGHPYAADLDLFGAGSLFEQLDNVLISFGLAVFRSEIDERVARRVEEGIDNPGNPRRSILRA